MEVKFPHIEVPLIGTDGNVFSVIGAVASAMRRNKVSKEDIAAFKKEAFSGDYDHVLVTCVKWVNVR